MSGFWVIAVTFTGGAIALLILPLILHRRDPGTGPSYATIGILAIALPAAAITLYLRITTGWPDQAAKPGADGNMPPIAKMVEGLEQKLARDPENLEGWIMLGRSRAVMRQFDGAAEAYARANQLSNGRDPDILIAYAEALAFADAGHVQGTVPQLIQQALAISPQHIKGLWMAGQVAWEQDDFEAAAHYWERMLPLAPAGEIRDSITKQIAAARAQSSSAAVSQSIDTTEDSLAFEIKVSVAPELIDRYSGATPVFVIARGDSAGPPLAVDRRLASELPTTVVLSDKNAMVQGRLLSDQSSIRLVARISLSGSPLASSGDLFGETDWRQGQDRATEIVIDRAVP